MTSLLTSEKILILTIISVYFLTILSYFNTKTCIRLLITFPFCKIRRVFLMSWLKVFFYHVKGTDQFQCRFYAIFLTNPCIFSNFKLKTRTPEGEHFLEVIFNCNFVIIFLSMGQILNKMIYSKQIRIL